VTAHWGIEDPVAATGDEAARNWAFSQAYRLLSRRISLFTSLPLGKLDRLALQRELEDIGATADPT
jgi:arsenate reductase